MTDTIRGVPEGYAEIKPGMTNFDHSIACGFEDRLRAEPAWGRHAAMDFNGRVWFENGVFHEQVWVYGKPRAHRCALTLAELMKAVNDEFGWE